MEGPWKSPEEGPENRKRGYGVEGFAYGSCCLPTGTKDFSLCYYLGCLCWCLCSEAVLPPKEALHKLELKGDRIYLMYTVLLFTSQPKLGSFV